MRLVPRALRPSAVVKRKAVYSGVLGSSGFWRSVAMVMFVRSVLQKSVGRPPEVIMVARLGRGRHMEIDTIKPLTRRQRRKLVRAGTPPPTLAQRRRAAQAEVDALAKR